MDTADAPVASRERVDIAGPRIAHWRGVLRERRETLRTEFLARPDTLRLLRNSARAVDSILSGVWAESQMPVELALVAVGGYGRRELYPHSDVDVLVLLPPSSADHEPAAAIERFFTALWDIGLEPGHAVRTVAQCQAEMAGDVTIRTSVLEHRQIAGSRRLYNQLKRAFANSLDVRAFYAAKVLEQQQRHLKYHDAAYNLEPNVKESPGGLRDLQTVLWIARAAGLGRSWRELAKIGLMTHDEARTVSRQDRLIGALRIRLHYLTGRREDRLVFDEQAALARELDLVDTPAKRASEQLMQRYYRAAKVVRQMNTILLTNLHARLYPQATEPAPIDSEFARVDEALDIRDPMLFESRPAAMLDAFLTLQRHPELKGMTAQTLRALWRNRQRIDGAFRRDPENRARFRQIFREPRGVT